MGEVICLVLVIMWLWVIAHKLDQIVNALKEK